MSSDPIAENPMQRSLAATVASCVALLALAAVPLAAQGADAAPAGTSDCPGSSAAAIDESLFVEVGGIEQWVTITGSRCDNPVVLFLHGGPGNPMSPFARTIHAGWEREFTLVQWDQRGAGRTHGRNPPAANARLTVEQMAQDGIELTAYLLARLNQKKLFLLGGSWGSVLGIHMAKARPDLFHAYVGVGQLVEAAENQADTYRRLVALARSAADAQTLAALEAIGPPPWHDPRNFGILRRATRVYERKVSDPAPAAWWVPSAPYATSQAKADYEDGEDFSYLQFVGPKGDGMLSTIDVRKPGTKFEVPIVLVQGAEDLVTLPEVARRYFDDISAPEKEFVMVPRTGHDPNQAMLDAQHRVLKRLADRAGRKQ